MSFTPPPFGWIPFDERTAAQNIAHEAAVATMQPFAVMGSSLAAPDQKKFGLWDFAKKVNGGKHFRPFYQKTGSCVGNGGGNAVWYLSAVEVAKLQEPEEVKLPFWLLPYGRSRMYGGLRGRGEGSFGSAFARAIRDDGIIEADRSDMPAYGDDNGISWGANTEYAWSDGAKVPSALLAESRKHPVRSTAQIKSADQAREAIRNGYPMTIASSWGGVMRCPVVGGLLLNHRADVWQHQMSVVGWQEHTSLGELFCVLNSWGDQAHGTPPDDAPPGSFWVKAADLDWICRTGEAFAFSAFEGFPAQQLDWYF